MYSRYLFWAAALLVCATVQILPQRGTATVPEGFPFSAWLENKEVKQIGWTVQVGQPSVGTDLRQRLTIRATISPQEMQKIRRPENLLVYARVLDAGRALGTVHSATPFQQAELPRNDAQIVAIVKPGKYRLELALLDPTSGRYSTKFENVSVEGAKHDPLERSFEQFSKFEFVPSGRGGIASPRGNSAGLRGAPFGLSSSPPTFPIKKPGVMHLSIIAVLTPPNSVIGDASRVQFFQSTLINILSPFTRMRVSNGTAQFTGIDLVERIRVFDRRDVQLLSPGALNAGIQKDLTTISFNAMTGMTGNARFIRDLLEETFDRAEKDTTNAEHSIVVIAGHTSLSQSLTPLPARRCRCSVHYLRVFINDGRDDIEKLLGNFKHETYKPLDWPGFREDFGKIYERLQLQK